MPAAKSVPLILNPTTLNTLSASLSLSSTLPEATVSSSTVILSLTNTEGESVATVCSGVAVVAAVSVCPEVE